MQKLNLFGQQLLNYKKELENKEYPKIVQDSLIMAVDKLATDEFINLDMLTAIKSDMSFEEFEEVVLSTEKCCKTKAELENEFEELRNKFMLELYEDMALIPPDISFENDIENELLMIKKDFLITEEFLKNYFYIPTTEDFDALMKRKGFIEKFAILRLEKIFNDFLEKNSEIKDFNLLHTNVFFNSETKNYGIQLILEINIDLIEKDENIDTLSNSVLSILTQAEEHYNIKMFG